GLLHNFFELRYVVGRYCLNWSRPLVLVTLVSLVLLVARRLFIPGQLGALIEIGLAYSLILGTIGASKWSASARGGWALLTILAATVSLMSPDLHFVVLAHLHNILPLFFLWWWSESLPSGFVRSTFRTVQVGWAVAIPCLILSGALPQAIDLAA